VSTGGLVEVRALLPFHPVLLLKIMAVIMYVLLRRMSRVIYVILFVSLFIYQILVVVLLA